MDDKNKLLGELINLKQQYALLFLERKSRKGLRSKIRKTIIRIKNLKKKTKL